MEKLLKLLAITLLTTLVLFTCLGITGMIIRARHPETIDVDGLSKAPDRSDAQQAPQSDFRIEVGGDPGVPFRGYITVTSGGGSEGERVEGTTPAGYSIVGDFVAVTFEKHDGGHGDLMVHILKKGTLVQSSETKVAYGVVRIAASR